jgi:DNA-binding transcriptional regulator YiaG
VAPDTETGQTIMPASLTNHRILYKLKFIALKLEFIKIVKKTQTLKLLPFEAEEVVTSIGEAVSLARRARGWTQSDLAAKMGVSVNTIVNLEKGRPSVAFGQVVMALWTLDRLDVLRAAGRVELDPVVQQEALRRMPQRARGVRGR